LVPRVPLKVGRVHRMRRNTEIIRILLPAAAPYLFTGVKLASAYSFIGIIAGEFILSGGGLDYAIAYAYEASRQPHHIRAEVARVGGGNGDRSQTSD
jgi:NitT/TauT family transport system permease protein